MAIDTAEKRRAVSGIPHHPLGVGVTPNLAKDVEWRQEAGWGYPGIAPAPPSGGGGGPDRIILGVETALGVAVFPAIGGGALQ